MENYDAVVGFDYTSEQEWKEWISNLLKYHKKITLILKARNKVMDVLKNNLSTALEKQSIKEMVLGGVSEDGRYTDFSIAYYYLLFFGIKFDVEHWISYCKSGCDPVKNGVKCEFIDTPAIIILRKINALLEMIASEISLELERVSDDEVEDLLSSSEKPLELIWDICEGLANFSVNYDYHMFFVLNTRSTPTFFLKKAYPKLAEHFEKIKSFLGLEEKLIVNSDDKDICEKLTFTFHKEGRLADLLLRLNNQIWEYAFRCFSWNLEKDYYERVLKLLNNIGWAIPPHVKLSDSSGSSFSPKKVRVKYVYSFNDELVVHELEKREYRAPDEYHVLIRKQHIPFLRLITDITPALFLGLCYIEPGHISERIPLMNSISIVMGGVNGWEREWGKN
jgi:hypothetical protein